MNYVSEHLSEKELTALLEQAAQLVEIGSYYAHYRDPSGHYKVKDIAILEATQEPAVIYQKEFGSTDLKSVTWIRPLSSWLEKVDHNGALVPRFQKVTSD